jgi:hypothetical protein
VFLLPTGLFTLVSDSSAGYKKLGNAFGWLAWRASEVAVNRRNWSNLFAFLTALNLVLGFWPANPVRVLDWMAVPACLLVSVVARQRMI